MGTWTPTVPDLDTRDKRLREWLDKFDIAQYVYDYTLKHNRAGELTLTLELVGDRELFGIFDHDKTYQED